jgi:hypothetical protein
LALLAALLLATLLAALTGLRILLLLLTGLLLLATLLLAALLLTTLLVLLIHRALQIGGNMGLSLPRTTTTSQGGSMFPIHGTFWKHEHSSSRECDGGNAMGRYLLLWLLGIPLPILILIWAIGGLH